MSEQKNKFHFLYIDKEKDKITHFRIYDVDKTQEEINELVEKFNSNQDHKTKHLQITKESNPMLVEFMDHIDYRDRFDPDGFKDIVRRLDDIVGECNEMRNEIEYFIGGMKKNVDVL